MKKLLSWLLVLALALSLIGCQKTDTLPTGAPTDAPTQPGTEENLVLDPDGSYDSKEDVALYIHLYGKLPSNFMTKSQAKAKGWKGSGSLSRVLPGKCLGGDVFYNREGLLPNKTGRVYYECDIGTMNTGNRGAKRIVYSNDGLVYYTHDHYESFELLYGNPGLFVISPKIYTNKPVAFRGRLAVYKGCA